MTLQVLDLLPQLVHPHLQQQQQPLMFLQCPRLPHPLNSPCLHSCSSSFYASFSLTTLQVLALLPQLVPLRLRQQHHLLPRLHPSLNSQSNLPHHPHHLQHPNQHPVQPNESVSHTSYASHTTTCDTVLRYSHHWQSQIQISIPCQHVPD